MAVEALATPIITVNITVIQTRIDFFILIKVALISCGKSNKNNYLSNKKCHMMETRNKCRKDLKAPLGKDIFKVKDVDVAEARVGEMSLNLSEHSQPAFQQRNSLFHPPFVINTAGTHSSMSKLLYYGKIAIFVGHDLA